MTYDQLEALSMLFSIASIAVPVVVFAVVAAIEAGVALADWWWCRDR